MAPGVGEKVVVAAGWVRVNVGEAVTEPVGAGVCVIDGMAVFVNVNEAVKDGAGDNEGEGVIVCVTVIENVKVGLCRAIVCVCVTLGDAVAEGVSVKLGDTVSVKVGLAVYVPVAVNVKLGVFVGVGVRSWRK